MNHSLAFVAGLLQSAFLFFGFLPQHHDLPQATPGQVQLIEMQSDEAFDIPSLSAVATSTRLVGCDTNNDRACVMRIIASTTVDSRLKISSVDVTSMQISSKKAVALLYDSVEAANSVASVDGDSLDCGDTEYSQDATRYNFKCSVLLKEGRRVAIGFFAVNKTTGVVESVAPHDSLLVAQPRTGSLPLTVTFSSLFRYPRSDGAYPYAGGRSLFVYFGDGEMATFQEGETVQHTYTAPGRFVAILENCEGGLLCVRKNIGETNIVISK